MLLGVCSVEFITVVLKTVTLAFTSESLMAAIVVNHVLARIFIQEVIAHAEKESLQRQF